jgi:inositol transporter-like SP family MFS transporter
MREQWRRTLLAAMANYIDAGSIVAGAVSLPTWAAYFGFGDSFISFLGAFSSNAIAAGLDALIGGRICDLLGRKKIYQWDLLLYAFGTCASPAKRPRARPHMHGSAISRWPGRVGHRGSWMD